MVIKPENIALYMSVIATIIPTIFKNKYRRAALTNLFMSMQLSGISDSDFNAKIIGNLSLYP